MQATVKEWEEPVMQQRGLKRRRQTEDRLRRTEARQKEVAQLLAEGISPLRLLSMGRPTRRKYINAWKKLQQWATGRKSRLSTTNVD